MASLRDITLLSGREEPMLFSVLVSVVALVVGTEAKPPRGDVAAVRETSNIPSTETTCIGPSVLQLCDGSTTTSTCSSGSSCFSTACISTCTGPTCLHAVYLLMCTSGLVTTVLCPLDAVCFGTACFLATCQGPNVCADSNTLLFCSGPGEYYSSSICSPGSTCFGTACMPVAPPS
jgi:hypothetical protein